MVMMTWLADVLRAAGCAVEEVDGWKARGHGEMANVRGVLCHHTGGPLSGDHPSLNLVLNGRPDLTGPLSHLVLGRGGTFFVVAAGHCNHAGPGAWQGITAGNSSFVGIEAENAGTPADAWPDVQMVAYTRGVAAILKHLGVSSLMAAGHREYALPRGRKIDPLFDMVQFRANVEKAMAGGMTWSDARPAPMPPAHAMLRNGDRGDDVKLLQQKLAAWFADVTKGQPAVVVDGVFGPTLTAAVQQFQHKNGMVADGIVGPATWKALGVTNACAHG